MKKLKHLFNFLQLDTVDIEWQGGYLSRRVIHWNTGQNCFITKFIYYLYVNACIFGFLMSHNKEKILRIIFLLSRCDALRDVKIPLILSWLYLVDLYSTYTSFDIRFRNRLRFAEWRHSWVFFFRKQVSREGGHGTRHRYYL